ncbi:MAG: acyl-CoA carboxylase subunit beta [Cytophagales bacterium]|nr:acyl-CoA carboxylase subunit beta [Cytophagales bacterium]
MDHALKEETPSLKEQCADLKQKLTKVYLGGGRQKIEGQHQKGKLTARERIHYLVDASTTFLEIGALAGEGMYEAHGGCPAGGVITGIGYIKERMCLIVANDATVKSGAWFPITTKKHLRAQEIAIQNKLPIIYLVDSAGVYLPLQEEIFPDKSHFGRVFNNNAKMSSMGIIQIAAIMGNCVAGGAYLPIMSDEAMIVDKTGSIFLAGAYLVKAAIGEQVDHETLGGATMHCEISGVTDNTFENDQACLEAIRSIFDKLGKPAKAGFDRKKSQPPKKNLAEIYTILPNNRMKPYDTLQIIGRLVDNSEFEQYKALYGKTLLCGYARIEGWAVGIVANQRNIVKTKKGEIQMGGVIYGDAADKAARFIMNCNQRKIPLVFLQDVTGFMVGSRAEQGGIIKDGAKMVNAVANSVVPKFTVIIGNSYGAGNYAMCGAAYDPRLIVAWPSAQIAVMGGKAAANTLLQIKAAAQKAQGKAMTEAQKKQFLTEITKQYQAKLHPYYAAARLWVDAIIDPLATREVIAIGIEAANHAPIMEKFNVGIIQT